MLYDVGRPVCRCTCGPVRVGPQSSPAARGWVIHGEALPGLGGRSSPFYTDPRLHRPRLLARC
ncbi:MAG: hypothetical protein ACLRWQ_19560 [Flavonifractor plautii]